MQLSEHYYNKHWIYIKIIIERYENSIVKSHLLCPRPFDEVWI